MFSIYMKEVLVVGASSAKFFVSLLLSIQTSVWRNMMLVCDLLYSNLMELCFLFNLFKQFVSCSLVPVHMKNISSMNRKWFNEIPWRKGYTCIFLKVIHENIHTRQNVAITFIATYLLVLFKGLFYCFYSLCIRDTCEEGFNIKRYQLGVIWDRFYCI